MGEFGKREQGIGLSFFLSEAEAASIIQNPETGEGLLEITKSFGGRLNPGDKVVLIIPVADEVQRMLSGETKTPYNIETVVTVVALQPVEGQGMAGFPKYKLTLKISAE